jgi:hypothetical protein
MVERELKGITMDQLAAAQKTAIQASKERTEQGTDVGLVATFHYLQCRNL